MKKFRFLREGEILRKTDLQGYGLEHRNGWKPTCDYGKKILKEDVGYYIRAVK